MRAVSGATLVSAIKISVLLALSHGPFPIALGSFAHGQVWLTGGYRLTRLTPVTTAPGNISMTVRLASAE